MMIQQAMVSDDFSFPAITEPMPHFVGSPSLWNVSYEVFSETSFGITGEREEESHRRKSFPMSDGDTKLANDGISKEDEERMDMLWENFNDELRRVSSLSKNKEEGMLREGGEWDSGVAGEEAELYCVKAWKKSKTSSAMISPKKPSLFTMVKVVKKLFLLHNSHCSKKSIS